MAGIHGIHHLSLKAAPAQYEAVIRFYCDVMGLPLLRRQTDAAFISCGNVVLEVLHSGEGRARSGALDHFAFAVENVEEMVEHVRRAGRPITMEPRTHTFDGEQPYTVRIAFFEGPAGESVELFCEK